MIWKADPFPRIDVLHHRRPSFGPVGSPQLVTMDAVVGGEEEGAIQNGGTDGVGVCASRVDVLHHGGSVDGAIALPGLRPKSAGRRVEEEPSIQDRRASQHTDPMAEPVKSDRARLGPVGPPQRRCDEEGLIPSTAKHRGMRTIRSELDILHQTGPAERSVALPGLITGSNVPSLVEHRSLRIGEARAREKGGWTCRMLPQDPALP